MKKWPFLGFGAVVVSGQGHELPTCFGGSKGRHRDSDWTLLGQQLLHGDDKDSGIVVGQSDMNYSNSCQIGQRHSASIPGLAFMDILYLSQSCVTWFGYKLVGLAQKQPYL